MTNIQTNEIASNVTALSDDALNEVAGGFNFMNFMLGHGDPRIGQFRAAAITAGALVAPGVIGTALGTVGSVVSHFKFW
jgi:hypothetical protein